MVEFIHAHDIDAALLLTATVLVCHPQHPPPTRRRYIAVTEHTPARWMPLEALREARFSQKSDVWAFGVLLWEICTLAKTPWGVFSTGEMADAIDAGDRLEKESTIPDKLYATMLRCWHQNPAKRPPFAQLHDELLVVATVLASRPAPAPASTGLCSGARPRC